MKQTDAFFTRSANVSGTQAVNAANTTRDLTAGTSYLVFTAGPDGAILNRLTAIGKGTNAATVMRVWINNGGSTANAANNFLALEIQVSATSASEVSALPVLSLLSNTILPAGYAIYVTLGVVVAAGFQVLALGQDF